MDSADLAAEIKVVGAAEASREAGAEDMEEAEDLWETEVAEGWEAEEVDLVEAWEAEEVVLVAEGVVVEEVHIRLDNWYIIDCFWKFLISVETDFYKVTKVFSSFSYLKKVSSVLMFMKKKTGLPFNG